MSECVRCGRPFAGTPWRYGSGGREHVDCDAVSTYRNADGSPITPPPPAPREFSIDPDVSKVRPPSEPPSNPPPMRVKRRGGRRPARSAAAWSEAERPGGGRQCEAMTKSGRRCQGGAMPGSPYCGPHQR
jgi:hypothetical protein